jgi:putative inorganic carbon (HCO3(-)) transporter
MINVNNLSALRVPQKFSISIFVSVLMVLGPLASFFTLTNAGYHDDQRALQLLCLLTGALLAIFKLWRGKPMLVTVGKPVAWLLSIFFALGLLSSMVAYSPRHAFYEWSSLGLLLVLAWLIANEVAGDPVYFLDKVLLVAGLGCAVYVFRVALVYIWELQSDHQPQALELIVGFNNIRFFNHVQTTSLPLLGLLTLRSMQQGQSAKNMIRCWWVLLSLWWMLLFVSAGRGALTGVLVGALMAIFWRGRHAWSWCRILLGSAMTGLAAYVVLFILVPIFMGLQSFWFLNEIAERSIGDLSGGRGGLWRRAIEMIVIHPLLGVGPLHFAHYGRDVNNGAHPHSWILQIASEWGIPALLCLSAVIFILFRKLLSSGSVIESTDIKNQTVLTVFLATGMGILVDGLVSGLIVMPSSQLWIVVYIGCAWGWVSAFECKNNRFRKSDISIKMRSIFFVLCLFMLVFVVNGVWPEIMDLPGREARELELHPGMRLNARIWGAGYF